MRLGFLSRSIRTKLLFSLTLVLVGVTLATNVVVTRLQADRLEAESVEMAESMRESSQAMHADLEQTSDEVSELTTREAEAAGAALADLLARVAPSAVVGNDSTALSSYVHGVNENRGVAYAAYVSTEGRPLTRYLDREKPALQPLLLAPDGSTRSVAEVIEASRSVADLRIFETPVEVEGDVLATAVLCLDRTAANRRLAEIDERFEGLSARQRASVDKANELVGATGRKIANESAVVLWFGAIITAFLVLFVAYWNMTAVLRRLRSIISMLHDISEGEGDLTKRLEVTSQDELAEVATWFNQFVEKTRVLVGDVKDAAVGLASMAEELSSTTVQIADGARAVSGQAEAVATAVEQMSSTVDDVARNTSEVGVAASTADQAARDGESVIVDSARAMGEIADVVGGASDTVLSLGKAADKITVVTEVIHDIADQTNLLALNAAIEAARAGEHGRGFAVVADEVRKLAEKTVKATGEISDLIGAITAESQRAVEAMDRGNVAVERGQEFGRQVGGAIEGIRAKVSNAAEQTSQIAAAIEELSSTNQETARSVVGIAREVGSTSSAAEQISSTTEELSRRAEGLRELTGRFRT